MVGDDRFASMTQHELYELAQKAGVISAGDAGLSIEILVLRLQRSSYE